MSKEKQIISPIANSYLRATKLLLSECPECISLLNYALQQTKKNIYLNDSDFNSDENKELSHSEIHKELQKLQKLNFKSKLYTSISIFKFLLVLSIILVISYIANNNYKQSLNSQWRASYFNNPHLNGKPLKIQYEPIPSHRWDAGPPFPDWEKDNFSVRWETILTLETDTELSFSTTSDDGVRLFIDEELVIDAWYAQFGVLRKVIKSLSKGPHKIKLEYYEDKAGADINLMIAPVKTSNAQKDKVISFSRPN